MKILLFNDTDNWAGTESHLLDLALGLRARGADASLACAPASPLAARGAQNGAPNLPVTTRATLDRGAIRALVRALKSGRADLIHAHNGRTQLNAACAIALARRGALVWTQHFITPHHAGGSGPKARVLTRVHRAVNARTNGFIAISHAVKRAMLERGETSQSQIIVVPNGIGDPQKTVLSDARARFEIADGAPLAVALSRLETEKDVATLLDAWRVVAARVPGARLLIGGQGAQRDALQAQIEREKLTESARLLGFVEDALSLAGAADVVVHAAPAEPFGLVFLEAMGLGKPVVACAGGAAPEIVENGETGLLVAPGNAPALGAALGAALAELLYDAPRARQFGSAGRARFEAHFTRDTMAGATFEVYQNALREAAL